MKKLLRILFFTLAVMVVSSDPMWAQTETLRPERVTRQKAVYNANNNTVTLTAVTPSKTEYDWDTYEQHDLSYISYISIKRHDVGTPWPDTELARITSPALGKEFKFVDTNVLPDKSYEYALTVHVDALSSQTAYEHIYTGKTPAPVKSFTATTVDANTNAIDLSVIAPDTAVTGEALSKPLTIRIQLKQEYFDYIDVHSFTDVEPGKAYTWKFEGVEMSKSYHFRAIAIVGTEGKSGFVDASTYVGLDYPGAPRDFTCVSEGEQVKITWKEPAVGGRGGSYAPEMTSYNLYRISADGTEEIAARGIQGNSYIDKPTTKEETCVAYRMTAVNIAGESIKDVKHAPVLVGKPAALPFKESFSNSSLEHKGWSTATTQKSNYYTYKAWMFPNAASVYYFPTDETLTTEPHDKDGGLAACLFYGYCEEGQTESLISPHINVMGKDSVILKFHYWFIPVEGMKDELKVLVKYDDTVWTSIFSSLNTEGDKAEWREIILPIKLQSNNQKIQIRFDGIFHGTASEVVIDNITVENAQVTNGIYNAVNSDNIHNSQIFTISGTRVNDMSAPGTYIIKEGTTTKKVIVK